ncbi:hypothetical protein THTE_1456 [Thermogutta terrifontis]|uniref:Uncharacterized protein n=1 Tax=Thermogutta terrifontis TaxID=1331910 RepID=A0A286RDL8_9BACT|nr:hypothetical protein THTE_1456 [Thermogutta terrifontis]
MDIRFPTARAKVEMCQAAMILVGTLFFAILCVLTERHRKERHKIRRPG